MPTEVTLLLKGSLVLFAQEGKPNGSVRILREPPPNHVLKIDFQKIPPQGQPGPRVPVSPVQDDLRINVFNPTEPNVTLRDKNAVIDRKQSPTHTESFRWIVDFENHELYNFPIGVKTSAFRQILTFNSGELFTDDDEPGNPSYNFLLCQHGINQTYEEFGFVAIQIGIKFVTNDRVVFTNGGGTVFDSAQEPSGTSFRINFSNDATSHPSVVTDANHYYKAVGSGIPAEERILFASIKQDEALKDMLLEARLKGDSARVAELDKVRIGPPAGPEAACFPAYLSRTVP